ncbi:sigma-54-dependent Fis family transcriptional regulator [Streptomyces sp. KR55]|uniref:sigma-54-dependent Fis family transcriptional regulator n=1 Tax=Streptomyces sp. KR55 TaxID=3457425 RepID=UPI003FCF5900
MADAKDFTRLSHRAREDFLTGRDPVGRVRAEVLASWRRSVLIGAPPNAAALPYTDGVDLDGALYSAARPVLTRLANRLHGTRAAVLLADRDGRVLQRYVDDGRVRAMMDTTNSAPGFCLREEFCGTNGLGTVLEEGRSFSVIGAEHFAEQFMCYACFGAPVRHPVTGRMQGVLTFLCPAEDASPLMPAFVEETCQAVQERILAAASSRERRLLDAFASASRRTSRALLAVNEHTVISTPAAARLVEGISHGTLWELAARAIAEQGAAEETWLTESGRVLDLRARPVADGDQVAGALVELASPRSERRKRPGDPVPAAASAEAEQRLLHRLGGTSAPWRHAMARAARVPTDDQPVLISGEAGTGKSELARALHELTQPDGTLHILNAALAAVDGPDAWLRRVQELLERPGPGTLVLTHLEVLPAEVALPLAALLDEHDPPEPLRLIGTTTSPSSAQPVLGPHVERLAVHRIELPPLHERRPDIPDLVGRLVRRYGGELLRCRPEVVQALARAPWPGNIRQLELVIRSAAAQRRTGDITLADLPSDLLHPSRRPLPYLADVELRAIVSALQRADGNKKLAARDLGISRSTLYRKLRSYHLDLERVAY